MPNAVSIAKHPLWEELRDRIFNLTGFYEDDTTLFIAEEAHRSDGCLLNVKKSDLVSCLDRISTDEDWDNFFDNEYDEIFNNLDRIWQS
jgi:hypothetical protein